MPNHYIKTKGNVRPRKLSSNYNISNINYVITAAVAKTHAKTIFDVKIPKLNAVNKHIENKTEFKNAVNITNITQGLHYELLLFSVINFMTVNNQPINVQYKNQSRQSPKKIKTKKLSGMQNFTDIGCITCKNSDITIVVNNKRISIEAKSTPSTIWCTFSTAYNSLLETFVDHISSLKHETKQIFIKTLNSNKSLCDIATIFNDPGITTLTKFKKYAETLIDNNSILFDSEFNYESTVTIETDLHDSNYILSDLCQSKGDQYISIASDRYGLYHTHKDIAKFGTIKLKCKVKLVTNFIIGSIKKIKCTFIIANKDLVQQSPVSLDSSNAKRLPKGVNFDTKLFKKVINCQM